MGNIFGLFSYQHNKRLGCQAPDSQKAEPESQQIISLLENQITDLKAQLSQASDREASLIFKSASS